MGMEILEKLLNAPITLGLTLLKVNLYQGPEKNLLMELKKKNVILKKYILLRNLDFYGSC